MNLIKTGSKELSPASAQTLSATVCTTALEALKLDQPGISKIKREHSYKELCSGIAYVVQKFFKVRHSKHQLTPELVDAFARWLLKHYWAIKLQEIELAFMEYRGEIYQSIDLAVLQDAVEVFDIERAKAMQALREERAEEVRKNEPKALPQSEDQRRRAVKVPDYIKELSRALTVKKHTDSDRPEKTLEEVLAGQNFRNPADVAERMRAAWKESWESLKIISLQNDHEPEPLESFLKNREKDYIYRTTRKINPGFDNYFPKR